MSRRMAIFSSFILLLFVVLVAQAANVQYFRAGALNASPENPRVNSASATTQRGDIIAADGTRLADSLPLKGAANTYQREYPLGSLTAGVVGYYSPALDSSWGLEEQYNTTLTAHVQPPESLEQVLAPTTAADSVVTTLYPALQRIAANAMGGQDGAAVVIQPRTGAVMAMYSNPTYEPELLSTPNRASDLAYFIKASKNDANGFPPLGLVATQQTFPPGSTFKVITTAAAAVYKPGLLSKSYKVSTSYTPPMTKLPLVNDGGQPCGGTVQEMLPQSCDPGYAHMGVDLGATILAKEANAFGYNSVPPIDLPLSRPIVSPALFPSAASFKYNIPFLAYSAIGQGNVRSTALQQALEAAAIANGGQIMVPHLMSEILGPTGKVISTYHDSVWRQPLTEKQAGIIVPLMEKVVTEGTASGVGFPYQDQVAAKTGTAQEKNNTETDDWMIAFAPASNPTVAVAVMMPYQAKSNYGATVAGPIVKCLIEGALAIQNHQSLSTLSTGCSAT